MLFVVAVLESDDNSVNECSFIIQIMRNQKESYARLSSELSLCGFYQRWLLIEGSIYYIYIYAHIYIKYVLHIYVKRQ